MAGRLPGITPSDVAIVALFLHKDARERGRKREPSAV
jgi:hypothetical protein